MISSQTPSWRLALLRAARQGHRRSYTARRSHQTVTNLRPSVGVAASSVTAEMQAEGDSTATTALAATAAILLSAAGGASYWAHRNAGSHNTRCEESAAASAAVTTAGAIDKNKLAFQVMAALETREELQKVRLAQVVNDLKKLVAANGGDKTQQADQRPGLRKYVTMAVESISKKEREQQARERERRRRLFRSPSVHSTSTKELHEPHINMHGENVSLEGVDLLRLSASAAQKIIVALRNGGRLNKRSLMDLVAASIVGIQNQPTLINLQEPEEDDADQRPKKVTVIGDLHGSLSCLTDILEMIGPIDKLDENHVIVFNGDFVDRGEQSVEVLATLLLLRLAYPKRVYLLRGNHEDHHVAAVYGFQDEIRLKYGSSQAEDIWEGMRALFSALPIGALTPLALILHGGLPAENFNLSTLEQVSPAARRAVETTIEPNSPTEELLADILWSDPSEVETGVVHNPRGCGKCFGKDVAKDFLERHNLLYLIRGHEPIEEGFDVIDCGNNRSVITVFSSAAYPGGQGHNKGAIITLDPEDGTYNTETFVYSGQGNKCSLRRRVSSLHSLSMIKSIVGANKRKLERAFTDIQFFDGFVTVEEWEAVLSEVLELKEMPWRALLEPLVPAGARKGGLIDWKVFLDDSCAIMDDDLGSEEAEILHENHEMLLTIFRFLDVAGKGEVGKEEFKVGVGILNQRLPAERQLQDTDAIFKVLDHNSTGSIDFEEFARLFRYM